MWKLRFFAQIIRIKFEYNVINSSDCFVILVTQNCSYQRGHIFTQAITSGKCKNIPWLKIVGLIGQLTCWQLILLLSLYEHKKKKGSGKYSQVFIWLSIIWYRNFCSSVKYNMDFLIAGWTLGQAERWFKLSVFVSLFPQVPYPFGIPLNCPDSHTETFLSDL